MNTTIYAVMNSYGDICSVWDTEKAALECSRGDGGETYVIPLILNTGK